MQCGRYPQWPHSGGSWPRSCRCWGSPGRRTSDDENDYNIGTRRLVSRTTTHGSAHPANDRSTVMSLTSLTTSDWHARAAGVRYETRHFIDGKYVDSVAGGRFTVVNPATGKPLCEGSAGIHHGETDRQSTRLNSSHLVISY